MDSHPFTQTPFVELLKSQQNLFFGLSEDSPGLSSAQVPLFGTQPTEASNCGGETAAERKQRRKWMPIDDVVLISSWLNTSKDHVVGNEQKSGAFWKRITAYFAASPKVAGCEHREAAHCKQRWHKINVLVNKFCGAYETASRLKSSGQNDNDVLKLAHEIFFNNHKKKSTLSMLGRSYAMTRNGVTFTLLKPMEVLKGGSLMTVHIHLTLTLVLKPIPLKLIKQQLVPRVLRHQRKRTRQRGR